MRRACSNLSSRSWPTSDGLAGISHRVQNQWWPEPSEVGKRELYRSRWRSRGFTFGTLVASVLLLVIATMIDWQIGCFTFIVTPFVCIHLGNALRREEARKREWLVDQPSHGEFSVKTLVEVNGVVRGADLGILWFETDAICFTGERTWFRIASQDILTDLEAKRTRHQRDEMKAGRNFMDVRVAGARLKIKFEEQTSAEAGNEGWMAYYIRRVRDSALASSTPTTLPPLGFDPWYRQNIWRDSKVTLWGVVAPLLALFLTASNLISTQYAGQVLLLAFAWAIGLPMAQLCRPAVIRALAKRHYGLRANGTAGSADTT